MNKHLREEAEKILARYAEQAKARGVGVCSLSLSLAFLSFPHIDGCPLSRYGTRRSCWRQRAPSMRSATTSTTTTSTTSFSAAAASGLLPFLLLLLLLPLLACCVLTRVEGVSANHSRLHVGLLHARRPRQRDRHQVVNNKFASHPSAGIKGVALVAGAGWRGVGAGPARRAGRRQERGSAPRRATRAAARGAHVAPPALPPAPPAPPAPPPLSARTARPPRCAFPLACALITTCVIL
jgi:hypothetical protein